MTAVSNTPPPYMRRCRKHSVFYNGEKYDACAVCRSAGNEPRLLISGSLIALTGLLFVGAGFYLISGPVVSALAQAGDDAIARTESTIRLDPAVVKPQLDRVDGVVAAANGEFATALISSAADSLASSIEGLQGVPRALATRFSKEIKEFGARVRAAGPEPDLAPLRDDWEVVRQGIFGKRR